MKRFVSFLNFQNNPIILNNILDKQILVPLSMKVIHKFQNYSQKFKNAKNHICTSIIILGIFLEESDSLGQPRLLREKENFKKIL